MIPNSRRKQPNPTYSTNDQHKDAQGSFSQPQSSHSERSESEWLDVEDFSPSTIVHSSNNHSQSNAGASGSNLSSQSLLSHSHQTRMEAQRFQGFDPPKPSIEIQQPQFASVRVSKACVPCREKRIRCQGGHPHCSTCIEKNRTHLCVYRIIPPRVVTRKALQELKSRLERTEDHLQQSREVNRDLNARLWEADKELEKLKSGEKVRELERHLKELKVRLYQSHSHPIEEGSRNSNELSSPQASKSSFGRVVSPSFPRHWISDDPKPQESFHPNKRPQLHGQPRASPYNRIDRTQSGSHYSIPQRIVDGGRVEQGQVDPNRRRAASTSTVHTNQQRSSSIRDSSIFDRQGGSDLRIGEAHQSFSSQHDHHHQVPRSQSTVSSGSSAFSPENPASPSSLPLTSPPVLEIDSGYLAGPLSFKEDVELEPCYLQTPFNDMNTIRHPTSSPPEISDRRHQYRYIDPKLHYSQQICQHEQSQIQQHEQASSHLKLDHQHHTSHSQSQSLPFSQFTFKPQFVKYASPRSTSNTSADPHVDLSEQRK